MSAVLTPTQAATARRGLAIYLTVVVVLSAPLQIAVIRSHDDIADLLWISALMLVPTLASVVARLVGREGFADLGFRRGRDVRRHVVAAALLPFGVGGVAYGVAWSTGLVGLRILPLGPWAALLAAMLVLNLVVATGEELGWRGYMLGHMVDAGVPHPILVSSAVWGLWHVPLFLWGGLVHDGPSPVVTTVLMLVTTTAMGYVLGRMTLDTGHVWPAVALHVVWNTVIQAGFDPAVTGEGKALWTGETGILTVVVLVAVAVAYRRRPRSGRGS